MYFTVVKIWGSGTVSDATLFSTDKNPFILKLEGKFNIYVFLIVELARLDLEIVKKFQLVLQTNIQLFKRLN